MLLPAGFYILALVSAALAALAGIAAWTHYVAWSLIFGGIAVVSGICGIRRSVEIRVTR